MKLPAANIIVITIAILSVLNVSCTQTFSYEDYKYRIPENVEDGLEVALLGQVGIDTPLIFEAVNRIEKGKHGEVHSMLIYKNDKLVFEEYFQGHKY